MPASAIEPWQAAADVAVQCDIDLAFHLWLERQEQFSVAIDVHGLGNVFSVIAAWDSRTAPIDSMTRVNELLVSLLAAEADYYRKQAITNQKMADGKRRSVDALDAARRRSAEVRAARARERDERLRQAGRDYFQQHPSHGLVDCVAFIRSRGLHSDLSNGQLEKKLRGVKSEALRSLIAPRTDLYHV